MNYGLSECGWVTNVYLSESKTITNYETIGKVNPGIEIKIIDSEGQSLPRDTTGQICILISPVELENILVTHESVVNAAVIGVDDSEDGEVPMGFVTVRDGCAVGEQELIDYVNKRVNNIKQIRVLFVPIDAIGHVNSAIGIAQVLLDAGHQCLFAINIQWKGRLTKYGIDEVLIAQDDRPTDVDPAQHWADLFVNGGGIKDTTPLETAINIRTKLMAQFTEETKGLDVIVDGLLKANRFNRDSKYLNIYGYPLELDYLDIRELPPKWYRFDNLK
ncbi:unnamed protein product, partial [Oppiella nova]